ncbi:hypothetical protein ACU686_07935 [Yinghuangia aomiensis]
MVVSGIFRELLRVQASGVPYQGTAQQFIEVVGGVLHSSTMIMRATLLPGGLLLNWRIEDEDERRGAQLAQAQRLAHIGIWDYDVGAGQLSWSPEVFGILGRDEADGVPDLDTVVALVDPADLPAAQASAQALFGRTAHADLGVPGRPAGRAHLHGPRRRRAGVHTGRGRAGGRPRRPPGRQCAAPRPGGARRGPRAAHRGARAHRRRAPRRADAPAGTADRAGHLRPHGRCGSPPAMCPPRKAPR